MVDAAKFADLVLLLIDASYGFEMVRGEGEGEGEGEERRADGRGKETGWAGKRRFT